MIVSFFDKYDIDISNLDEKLDVISHSTTENAVYISHTLKNAINYLFKPVELDLNDISNGIPSDIEDVDCIMFFDTSDDVDIKVSDLSQKVKLIIVGTQQTKIVPNGALYLCIDDLKKIKKEIKDCKNILVGFNIDSIDFSKYYYGRMRTYFLNVLNSLNDIFIDELNDDVEGVCTRILLNNNNFECMYETSDSKIKLKSFINIYCKIINMIGNTKMFTFFNEDKLDLQKKIMLNEISMIIKIGSMKDDKEKLSIIYDTICNQMLEEAKAINYCNFIDNKCITMRYTDGFPNSKENGCCSNTYKDRRKDCRYLNKDHSCAICSISCRVFTCVYLQRRGIDHSLWQYPIIDCLIRKFAKTKMIFSFFIPKEKMIMKLKRRAF